MHLPNSTYPWPTLHPPWSPGLPQWEDHRQPRTTGPWRGTGPETRWRVLLRQVRPWHVLCSGLNHWIRRLETDAFNSLPNKWLWQWRWVVEKIKTIKTSKRLFVCLQTKKKRDFVLLMTRRDPNNKTQGLRDKTVTTVNQPTLDPPANFYTC